MTQIQRFNWRSDRLEHKTERERERERENTKLILNSLWCEFELVIEWPYLKRSYKTEVNFYGLISLMTALRENCNNNPERFNSRFCTLEEGIVSYNSEHMVYQTFIYLLVVINSTQQILVCSLWKRSRPNILYSSPSLPVTVSRICMWSFPVSSARICRCSADWNAVKGIYEIDKKIPTVCYRLTIAVGNMVVV